VAHRGCELSHLAVKVPDQPSSTLYDFADVKEAAQFLLKDWTTVGPSSAITPDTVATPLSAPSVAVKQEEVSNMLTEIKGLAKNMAAFQVQMSRCGTSPAPSSHLDCTRTHSGCLWCRGTRCTAAIECAKREDKELLASEPGMCTCPIVLTYLLVLEAG
jgi:hypothetical protein